MITVYIRRIESISEKEMQKIMKTLSVKARERLDKKRNEKLFLASLCALSLLDDTQRADLEYTDEGSPYFATLGANISITHSKTHAAVALSDSQSTFVGIDAEDLDTAKNSTRFLTENEKKLAYSEREFIEIWTKKESLFKFLKNDSTPFILLDSTMPEKYGARFIRTNIDTTVVSICAPKNEEISIIQK